MSKPMVEGTPIGFAISENDKRTMAMVSAALDERRVALAYQPVVLGSDPEQIAFYEGLIRVIEPSGRIIPARDFMNAVEEQEMHEQEKIVMDLDLPRQVGPEPSDGEVREFCCLFHLPC